MARVYLNILLICLSCVIFRTKLRVITMMTLVVPFIASVACLVPGPIEISQALFVSLENQFQGLSLYEI